MGVAAIAVVIFVGVVVSSQLYRNTEPYEIMKEMIISDSQVREIFGEEFSFGFFVTGRFSELPVKGTRYKFSLYGNGVTGKVNAWTKRMKTGDKWENPTILITLANGKTIRLE